MHLCAPSFKCNTQLQRVISQWIKHMVGYAGLDAKSLENSGYGFLLDQFEHYGPGDVRAVRELLNHVDINIESEK